MTPEHLLSLATKAVARQVEDNVFLDRLVRGAAAPLIEREICVGTARLYAQGGR